MNRRLNAKWDFFFVQQMLHDNEITQSSLNLFFVWEPNLQGPSEEFVEHYCFIRKCCLTYWYNMTHLLWNTTRIFQFHVLAPHGTELEHLLNHHPAVQRKWRLNRLHPIKIKNYLIMQHEITPRRNKPLKPRVITILRLRIILSTLVNIKSLENNLKYLISFRHPQSSYHLKEGITFSKSIDSQVNIWPFHVSNYGKNGYNN